MKTSPKYKLIKEDLLKVGKGALIAVAGALLTYITDTLPNVDFGAFTPVVVAFWSVVVNAIRKHLTRNDYEAY